MFQKSTKKMAYSDACAQIICDEKVDGITTFRSMSLCRPCIHPETATLPDSHVF